MAMAIYPQRRERVEQLLVERLPGQFYGTAGELGFRVEGLQATLRYTGTMNAVDTAGSFAEDRRPTRQPSSISPFAPHLSFKPYTLNLRPEARSPSPNSDHKGQWRSSSLYIF